MVKVVGDFLLTSSVVCVFLEHEHFLCVSMEMLQSIVGDPNGQCILGRISCCHSCVAGPLWPRVMFSN